jgi:HSP20 family protein
VRGSRPRGALAFCQREKVPTRALEKSGCASARGEQHQVSRQRIKTMNMLTKWSPFQTTRWNPLKELAELERGFGSFFHRLPALAGNGEEPITEQIWVPLADISEDDKEYLVKVELPEMKKEEVKVTVENGVLRITGERKAEKEEKTEKYHRIERSYGAFERAFTLPDGADGTKVSADYKDCLLTVRLPKTAEAKPKAIEVKVA